MILDSKSDFCGIFNEQSMTPAEYKYNVLAGVLDKVPNLYQQAKNLAKCLEDAQDFIEDFNTIAPQNLTEKEEVLDQILKQLLPCFDRMKSTIFMAYSILATPDTFEGQRSISETLLSDDYEKTSMCFHLDLKADNEKLIVKLPILWSRYGPKQGVPAYIIAKGYWCWFGSEIERLFLQHENEIPPFRRSHFSFVHVLDPNKSHYPDNDNYDTKFITDKIISCIGGTDGPLQVSFSSMSLPSTNLEEGTYVVVSHNYNQSPSLQTLKEWLKTAFLA